MSNKNGRGGSPRPPAKKKKMSAGKVIILIIALIILALGAFIGTIKLLVPDYDLTALLPEKIQTLVKEDDSKQTSEAAPETTEQTTKPKPTEAMLDYLEDKEFKLDTSKQGNFIGNLLNGGKVGTDYTYVYHIVDGKGIYRFSPGSEDYSNYYKTDHILSSMNLRGDYIYFVDETNGNLQKLQKGTSKPKTIAQDVKFVYVYDSLVFYITNDNSLCVMDAKELSPTALYNSADNELRFIGISKDRVFFSVEDENEIEFLTVDNKAEEKVCAFRENESKSDASCFVMENGFLYYIKADSDKENSVIRQKFGSNKIANLAQTKSSRCYPIIDNNKLFYTDFADNKLILKELNMNTKKSKTMLKSDKLSSSEAELSAFHGGEYDFIIGDGKYRASSNLTSSTNVMKLKDGKWSY